LESHLVRTRKGGRQIAANAPGTHMNAAGAKNLADGSITDGRWHPESASF
jgi:hypothetical protein